MLDHHRCHNNMGSAGRSDVFQGGFINQKHMRREGKEDEEPMSCSEVAFAQVGVFDNDVTTVMSIWKWWWRY